MVFTNFHQKAIDFEAKFREKHYIFVTQDFTRIYSCRRIEEPSSDIIPVRITEIRDQKISSHWFYELSRDNTQVHSAMSAIVFHLLFQTMHCQE